MSFSPEFRDTNNWHGAKRILCSSFIHLLHLFLLQFLALKERKFLYYHYGGNTNSYNHYLGVLGHSIRDALDSMLPLSLGTT